MNSNEALVKLTKQRIIERMKNRDKSSNKPLTITLDMSPEEFKEAVKRFNGGDH